MKFRTSFQLPRPSGDEGNSYPHALPFNMGSLRKKKSRPTLDELTAEQDSETTGTIREEEQTPPSNGQRINNRKHFQDFLRATGSQLRATGAHIRASTSVRLPQRAANRNRRKSRIGKQPPSKRNSRLPAQSFDISDDVLNRLMGPPKDPSKSKYQSESFFLQQRVRAGSGRVGALGGISPGQRSQAELDRTPLSEEEVVGMFVGAPYFNVQRINAGKGGDGAKYRPQVIFRGGDVEESARYGTDYTSLGNESYGACTLGLHRTRETGEGPASWSHEADGLRGGNGFMEVPSMLSANGLDAGTIGFEHFLQLPVADSAILPDEPTFFEKRKLLYTEPEKLGLRTLNMEMLIDRLTELGEVQAARNDGEEQRPWNDEKVAEMGEDLFAKLLDPELGTTGAGTGSVTLRTQIIALQTVLNESELWHNFGQVEWRIRVGQLLWTSHEDEAPQLDENRQPSERDVLLLQITLAAELLVRLNAVKAASASTQTFPPSVTVEDREAISTNTTRKLQWDVLLAEIFLNNLTISAKVPTGASKAENRSSLFSAITFLTAKETPEDVENQTVEPLLYPKNETKQLAGLLSFAERLQWPHAEEVQRELEAKLTAPSRRAERPISTFSAVSNYMTPLSSPRLPSQTPSMYRNSYFGGNGQQKRPGMSRMTTANSIQLFASNASGAGPDAFEVGGWLSRSWLSGLVLPGEPASHFLVSTLLENSPQAIEVLGDAANLYGGFVYQGRGFWSKSCAVGRVLAAARGAGDVMGWLSVPIAPQGGEEGWINVEVKDAPTPASNEARIKDSEAVAKESDPLHGSALSGLQAGDFTTPFDGPPVMGNEVKFEGLTFTPSQSSFELTKAAAEAGDGGVSATSTSIAQLTFTSPLNSRISALEVPINYDVHFVASYPCHPPLPSTRSPTSPKPTDSKIASPALDQHTSSSPSSDRDYLDAAEAHHAVAHTMDSIRASAATLSIIDIEKDLPPPPAHPLHIDYLYSIIPAASLLTTPVSGRARALSDPEARGAEVGEEVVILDCRGTEDLELLARAWCAKVGENAIIGKSGRTCLACCVREARALGVGIVIRT